MLCQKCHQSHAQFHLQMNNNGIEKQVHLCSSCYKAERAKIGSAFGPSMSGFSNFNQLPMEDLFKKFIANDQKHETHSATPQHGGAGGDFINQFGQNLNQMARAGLIDPVIGREEEVNRVIEILNRRNKNNPVLIGEPGVGKTAIAEELAVKIAEGKAPNKLKNKEVYLLDVASLVENTGIRGQFEERMKQRITELQQRKNIILFIDEIHLLVGAGSAEGSMDAGNILKPALARGEEAGQLTEKVRRNPYSIILLDEIEKAHPDVQHMFLQILDDGRLTDSQGRVVSFKDTVIIMTINAGIGHKQIKVGFGEDHTTSELNILDSLGSFFKPEFLNRFDSIIEFKPLEKHHLLKIVDLMLKELNILLKEQGMSLTVTDEVKDILVEKGYNPTFGARPLRRVIQEQLEDKIADLIIDEPNNRNFIAFVEDNQLTIRNS